YEDVVGILEEADVGTPTEDASSLHQAVAEARQQLRSIDTETQTLTRTIEERTAEFGSWEQLQEKTGALRYRSSQIREEMSGLAALPDGFDSTGSFIDHVEALERRRETARTQVSESQQQKAEIEANAPEESAEELQGRLRLAEKRFAEVVARGEALLRVSERAHSLQQELDSDTWQPLQELFQRRLESTARGRFSTVHMDALDTTGFVTAGGAELSPQQLSWGTRDSVALALRMTLAEYAIGDAGGFVIFDDPLVDMDPDRRALACRAISGFSEAFQTVVLTCHPEHARELGGTLVELA
ncbi:MAG: ATP-binding protein, partial [Spirochaetia bacterium]